MKILIKGKVETVLLDRVKPAHFDCEPATGTTTQRIHSCHQCLYLYQGAEISQLRSVLPHLGA